MAATTTLQVSGIEVHLRESIRPLVGLEEIVATLLQGERWLEGASATRVDRVVTDEGEFALVVRLDGTRDGAPAAHLVGVVLGDGAYDQLEAFVPAAAADAALGTLTELTREHTLDLGTDRVRWFPYDPPAGFRYDGVSSWRTDDGSGVLTVERAVPAGRREAFNRRSLRWRPTSALRERAVQHLVGPRRLTGELRWLEAAPGTGGLAHRFTATLTDGTFTYVVHLDASEAGRAPHLQALRALLLSIMTIPRPTRTAEVNASLGHWAA